MRKIIIDRFSAFLLGSDLWGKAQAVVKILEDGTLSGAEKRAEAVKMLNALGLSALGFLLNLAIELAVAKLKMG